MSTARTSLAGFPGRRRRRRGARGGGGAGEAGSDGLAAVAARTALTLHAPGLLGPWPAALAREITRGLEVDGLARILARARRARRARSPPAGVGVESCERLAFAVFGFVLAGGDVPAAALAWESDAASAAPPAGRGAGGCVRPPGPPRLRADPVHIRADLQAARLLDAAHFDLAPGEAAAMTGALNRHFESEGIRFAAPHPTRWYVWAKDAAAAAFHPPGAVVGQDAGDRLPSGREGAAWRRRMTEAQMVLHDLGVNGEREARGELPVNSVWFWGAGEAPLSPGRPFDEVWAEDPLVRALAARSGALVRRSPREVSAHGLPAGHLLIAPGSGLYRAVMGRDVEGWRREILALDEQWLAPIADALSRGRVRRLRIDAGLGPGRATYEAGGWRSRWPMRGRRPLADFVAAPDGSFPAGAAR